MDKPTAVIVEDEAFIALDLEDMCRDAGYRVLGTSASARAARERFGDLTPDVLITDMELVDGSLGTEVAVWMRGRLPGLRVVFVTGTCDPRYLAEIDMLRPDQVLRKPVLQVEFGACLSRLAAARPPA
ncbi:response regulator [Halovulum sp. GXIMD14794]